jgi:hypothetical protein
MKIERSKEWWMEQAKQEGNSVVSAGGFRKPHRISPLEKVAMTVTVIVILLILGAITMNHYNPCSGIFPSKKEISHGSCY